ncbi:MAG: type II secretion system F family protein [Angustibacter sp.]
MTGAVATGVSAALAGAAWLCWPMPRGGASCRASSAPQVGASAAARGEGSVGIPDVVLVDLVVAALAAGLPTTSAVAAARWAAAPPGGSAADGGGHALPVAVVRAFALAERTGASAAELLRRAAADERAARRAALAVAASRLGVRLVVPLGLAVLPAFVLLGVAPVVIGLAQQLLSP